MSKTLGFLLACFFMITIGCDADSNVRFIEDLNSENVMVKKNAIYHLGKSKEKRAIPMLVSVMNESELKEVRLLCIDALGSIGKNGSIEALADILREKDVEMKKAAVEALGKSKNPKAVKHLLPMIEDKEVRLVAIWALGNIGDKSAIAGLTNVLDDEDEYIRHNAAQSLKKIGSAE